MHRQAALLAVSLALAACGGGGGRVSGEIGQACMRADRDAANARLCSCVQQAANQTLSGTEQRRAARFFADPHQAQETRQSDRAADETFWQRYRAFATYAESICS